MPKQQVTIEVDVPEGFEFVRFGTAKKGESVINHVYRTVHKLKSSAAGVFVVQPTGEPASDGGRCE